MPVFDSNLSIKLESRHGFGKFWTFTVPLTAMVLLMWLLAHLVRWKGYGSKRFPKELAGSEKMC